MSEKEYKLTHLLHPSFANLLEEQRIFGSIHLVLNCGKVVNAEITQKLFDHDKSGNTITYNVMALKDKKL